MDAPGKLVVPGIASVASLHLVALIRTVSCQRRASPVSLVLLLPVGVGSNQRCCQDDLGSRRRLKAAE